MGYQRRGPRKQAIKTSIHSFDQPVGGLHGTTLICAEYDPIIQTESDDPSVEWALGIELSLCILRRRRASRFDTLLMLSLEQTRTATHTRMLSRISGLSERVVLLGDHPSVPGRYHPDTLEKIDRAVDEIREIGEYW